MPRLRCKGYGRFISPDQAYTYIDGEFYCFRKWCKEIVIDIRENELILWAEKVIGKPLTGREDEEKLLKKFK